MTVKRGTVLLWAAIIIVVWWFAVALAIRGLLP